jgi:hypothetical protein
MALVNREWNIRSGNKIECLMKHMEREDQNKATSVKKKKK